MLHAEAGQGARALRSLLPSLPTSGDTKAGSDSQRTPSQPHLQQEPEPSGALVVAGAGLSVWAVLPAHLSFLTPCTEPYHPPTLLSVIRPASRVSGHMLPCNISQGPLPCTTTGAHLPFTHPPVPSLRGPPYNPSHPIHTPHTPRASDLGRGVLVGGVTRRRRCLGGGHQNIGSSRAPFSIRLALLMTTHKYQVF